MRVRVTRDAPMSMHSTCPLPAYVPLLHVFRQKNVCPIEMRHTHATSPHTRVHMPHPRTCSNSRTLDQTLDQRLDQTLDQRLDQTLDQRLDQRLDQKLHL